MIYIPNFFFPDERTEEEFLNPRDLSPFDSPDESPRRDFSVKYHRGSFYPFRVLTKNKLEFLRFESVTVLCGKNGCGKTTALNIIAEKLHLQRDSLFNSGRYFPNYLERCKHDALIRSLPIGSRIIVSDDVFEYSMKRRVYNQYQHETRESLELRHEYLIEKSEPNLQSLDDYERWSERREAMKSRVNYINKRLDDEKQERSNGETALSYFLERMDGEGLYLLDEPENSLSVENQIALAEYIELSARFYGCQFIIASHSPIFLSIKDAAVYDFDSCPVKAKKWTELEGVRALFDFFENRRREFKEGVDQSVPFK